MTGQIVTRADGSVLDPSGCGVCGINERSHFERWASGPGWHRWTEPTSEQRLERMLARRAARNTTPETTQVPADATTRTHHTDTPKEGLMTNTESTENDQRAAYIAGLRQLANALESHPEIPLPYHGESTPISFMFFDCSTDADNRTAMADTARALPCNFTKKGDDKYFRLVGNLAGLKIQLDAFREEVCERVVTGVDEVEVEERDPDAVAAAMATVPAVKVTKKVETVEWRCTPLLAAEKAGAVA